MQPDITAAQLAKAQNEAKASAYQPDLTAVQLDKNRFETKAASFQPDTAAAQLAKSQNEAKASAYQPNLAAVQLEKSTYEANATAYAPAKALAEAKAAQWQPALAAAQGYESQMKWLAGVPNDEWQKAGNVAIANERPTASDMGVLRASKPVMPSPAETGADIPIKKVQLETMKAGLGLDVPKPAEVTTNEPPPPSSSPPPPGLRKPVAFDCAKASMGVDYVICASPKLLDDMARL